LIAPKCEQVLLIIIALLQFAGVHGRRQQSSSHESGNQIGNLVRARAEREVSCLQNMHLRRRDVAPISFGLGDMIPKYGEIRCYIRDPDGYIIEVGQSTDLKQKNGAYQRPFKARSNASVA
jgi:hypothetical protein